MSAQVETSYNGFKLVITNKSIIVHDRKGVAVKWCASMAAARRAVAELRKAEREEAA